MKKLIILLSFILVLIFICFFTTTNQKFFVIHDSLDFMNIYEMDVEILYARYYETSKVYEWDIEFEGNTETVFLQPKNKLENFLLKYRFYKIKLTVFQVKDNGISRVYPFWEFSLFPEFTKYVISKY
jgi:hypothetical protein